MRSVEAGSGVAGMTSGALGTEGAAAATGSALSAGPSVAEQVFAAAPGPMAVLDPDLRLKTVNPAFHALFGGGRDGAAGVFFFALQDGAWDDPDLRDALAEVSSAAVRSVELEVTARHGVPRYLRISAEVLGDGPDILLSIADVTVEREGERAIRALRAETRHRIRNLLAKVGAIVSLSRRDHDSVHAYAERLGQRISAIARAEDLIGGRNPTVDVRDLLAAELAALRVGLPVPVEGPAVALPATTAQALALALHELATNAVRYGAFATPGAALRVVMATPGQGAEQTLRFEWLESGVPIGTPPRPGFGSRLIREIVPQMLGGSSDLSFGRDGVRCVIEFPLSARTAGPE